MSAAATTPNAPGGARSLPRRDARGVFLLVSISWIVGLAWGLTVSLDQVTSKAFDLALWTALFASINLLPVRGWRAVHFSADSAVTVAGALVLGPVEMGLVAFLGAFDPAEFRGELGLLKSAFNRSQIGFASLMASLTVHAIAQSPTDSATVLPLAFLALGADAIINYVLVSFVIAFERRYRLAEVMRRLRVGTWRDFALAIVTWAVLGAMLSALYGEIGRWALLAFLAPTLLGREILVRSQSLVDTSQAYESRKQSVVQLSNKIYEERNDERRMIAADLHDEVLQPLFKVTLMANVLKADLDKGRLLEMDKDLPDLMSAADIASSKLREVIGDLRKAPIGRRNLSEALRNLVRRFGNESSIQIQMEICDQVDSDPQTQLALYQIAKEALGNALLHSSATQISLSLREDQNMLLLEVKDNGRGFDPYHKVDGHFGLAIMRERALAAGGQLFVDSLPAAGCSVRASVPKSSLTEA